ncbi:restriction endonuclease subunit S [Teredinibacter turnerae]|uniref:restriction endonuclease subunit S n=1 Tax=Teredinibacter turnerae TaxID=2426 RepID=UPI0030D2174A
MSSSDEVLPHGWEKVKVREIFKIEYGKSLTKAKRVDEGKFPVVGSSGILGFHNEYLIEQKSIVIGRKGSVGSLTLLDKPSWPIDTVYYLIPPKSINIKFTYFQLLTKKLEELDRSTTIPGLNRDDFYDVDFFLCGENEQTRIVEKLEELLSDLDNGVAALKAAQIKLTQYRQSLLKSAVEGSLTAEWRSQNTPSETGARLLERILKERRQRWEQQKLAEFKTKNQKPPKDWQKKYPEPVKPDTSNLPELPEGWVWANVDQLAWNKRYGSSSKTNDDTSGIPVLRMGNIQDGEIDFRNLKYLPQDHNEFPALLLSDGDLLFNRTNSAELVGKTAVFRDIGKPCSYASYLISVTFCDSYQPDLAAYFINSSLGKAWLSTVVNQTAGQANVNGTKLGELAIPVPPFDEQLAIIREMNSNQEQVSTQLENVELGIKQSESQRRNILKDAFSGKLVPQDPNDEPASILLDKVKAERVAQVKLPKPKRAKKKPNTMKNFDLDALKKWIAEFDKEHFTFADIEAGVSADYENLKNLIFLALSESQPAIYQKFDENSEEMVFKKAGV